MPTPAGRARHLLIISRDSGSLSDADVARLRGEFTDFRIIDFNTHHDFRKDVTPQGTVVIAGGDGSVGWVARALAGSRRRLGIIAAGTYNNFARSLAIPDDITQAIAVVRTGVVRPVTLGMVNKHAFLEIGAIGLFGKAIELGESVKDGSVSDLPHDLRAVAGARPFEYTLSGDIDGTGRALSLVVSNTPTTGAQMAVSDSTPRDPELELAVRVGASRSDVVGRVLASVFLDKHVDGDAMNFRFHSIRVSTRPRVAVYADNRRVARTPVTISAAATALHVIVPA